MGGGGGGGGGLQLPDPPPSPGSDPYDVMLKSSINSKSGWWYFGKPEGVHGDRNRHDLVCC